MGHLGGVGPIVGTGPKSSSASGGAEVFFLRGLAKVFGCLGSVPEVFSVPRECTRGIFGASEVGPRSFGCPESGPWVFLVPIVLYEECCR